MAGSRLRRSVAIVVVLPVLVHLQGCGADEYERVEVSLKNTETYEYPTVGGDEEGAVISRQAEHYSISEMRRGPATNWIATYVYRPAEGFVGVDSAEIEIHTGSDGASAPTRSKRVAFRFTIHD